ncbi:MAG: hypothetical protein CMA60_00025 [Euryarchaeota archaeon]|nr:hypothetical protein [Euryarchaeota archaeon]|tara:strand:+ start:4919 stop:8788 length:3870 start_codon:yes stop_codon:yes gene_type:complete
MSSWTVTIDFKDGESTRDRMVRIATIIAREKDEKKVENVSMSRQMNEISRALASTRKDQNVVLSSDSRGSLARRSPTVKLATNTGIKELDDYISKTLPDMSVLDTYASPRQRALSLALPTAIGVPSSMRVPNLENEDRLMAANILGSLPSGGMALEDSAKNKLAAVVKQTLGDLGLGAGEVKSMLRDRLSSRPFFNDPTLINNFANMIKSYHDVREYNLHYAQALVPGLKGVNDPKRLTAAILPTPESILNGTTAYLIYRVGEKPSVADFKGFVREALFRLLNLQPGPRGLRATDKQLEVGAFLAAFKFNRKKAAKALMKAVDEAMSVGGDFVTAYAGLTYENVAQGAGGALDNMYQRFEDKKRQFEDKLDNNEEIMNYEPEGGEGADIGANDKRFFKFLERERMIFEIKEGFYLIPVVLPAFDVNPIGWDRRWMIATMKIIDEYWDMIYGRVDPQQPGRQRKILLQDLLFLIATRTKELFNYDIDVIQMTILTLLLTQRPAGARRRARSILPKGRDGEIPLRDLTQLLKESTVERDGGEELAAEDAIVQLQNELAVQAIGGDVEQAENLAAIQDIAQTAVSELRRLKDNVAASYGRSEPASVAVLFAALDPIILELNIKLDDVKNAAELAMNQALELDNKEPPGDLGVAQKEEIKSLGAAVSAKIVEIADALSLALFYSKDAMVDFVNNEDEDTLKEIIANYGFNIKLKKRNGDARDKDEIAGDFYDQRFRTASRRAARRARANPPSKEVGFITAEIVVGSNFVKDIGMGIRDFVGGRSERLEKLVDDALGELVKELYDKAASLGGDYVDDIAIQPIVYGGSTMLTLIAHGVAYDTGGKKNGRKARRLPPFFSPYESWDKLSGWLEYPEDLETAKAEAQRQAIRTGKGVYLAWLRRGFGDPYSYYTTEKKRDADWYGKIGSPSSTNTDPKQGVVAVIEPKTNPMEKGRVDAYDSYMLAKNAALAQANKYDETVYLWREDGKIKVSRFFPGLIPPGEVSAIHPNPIDTTFHDGWQRAPPPVWRFKEAKASMKKYRNEQPWVYPGQTNHGGIFEVFQNARNAPQNYERGDIYFDMQMPGRPNDIDVFVADGSRFRQIGTLTIIKKLGDANPPKKRKTNPKGDEYHEWTPIADETNLGESDDIAQTIANQIGKTVYVAWLDIEWDDYHGDYHGAFHLTTDSKKIGGVSNLDVYHPERQARKKNPPKKEERKYKGMIISKVDDGWEVDAYGKVFKTLKEARDFISKKVKGTAVPNQQCVRIVAGTRCIGTIVKMNKGGHYQCKKCKAKYRAV